MVDLPDQSSTAEWDLFLILPNLNPRVPSPFRTKYLCLCSGKDPLVESVVDSAANRTGLAMLRQYRTWFGKSYVPGCLLVQVDAPDAVRFREALRSFRNVCALASVTHAFARKLTGAQWGATYTDFFVVAAHIADKMGWIGKVDGVVGGTNDEVDRFRGLCNGQIDLPDAFTIDVDGVLFNRLTKAWEAQYVAGPNNDAFLRLFRSLEVAFHAAQFPSDGLTSIHDAGTRIGLWVSAFEVLCHPGTNARVNKRVVHDFLNKATLSNESLSALKYDLRHKGQIYQVSQLGVIYEQLYEARNAFMHGNPVTGQQLFFNQDTNRPHLFALAALLYNVALRVFTEPWFPSDEDDERDDFFFGLGEIEKALSAAL